MPGTPSTATGRASFTLSEDESTLAYQLAFDRVNLNAPERTAPADVNKIHCHAAPFGPVGIVAVAAGAGLGLHRRPRGVRVGLR